jgi:hypothetical protein
VVQAVVVGIAVSIVVVVAVAATVLCVLDETICLMGQIDDVIPSWLIG